mmetsp:Transcript_22343/g.67426  ORF Transcript_22343/g.67426 Transcript_22343/m.67426 type:complete len:331 (-) Transcript_22343:257-1249(-)
MPRLLRARTRRRGKPPGLGVLELLDLLRPSLSGRVIELVKQAHGKHRVGHVSAAIHRRWAWHREICGVIFAEPQRLPGVGAGAAAAAARRCPKSASPAREELVLEAAEVEGDGLRFEVLHERVAHALEAVPGGDAAREEQRVDPGAELRLRDEAQRRREHAVAAGRLRAVGHLEVDPVVPVEPVLGPGDADSTRVEREIHSHKPFQVLRHRDDGVLDRVVEACRAQVLALGPFMCRETVRGCDSHVPVLVPPGLRAARPLREGRAEERRPGAIAQPVREEGVVALSTFPRSVRVVHALVQDDTDLVVGTAQASHAWHARYRVHDLSSVFN